jgi:DNA-binding response OmpR family regulator
LSLSNSSKKKVLIADDEPHILELVKISLEPDQYEVLQASDGEQALRLALQNVPDLILLDVQMPKMDGYQVCSALRSNGKTRSIPIYILSGKDKPADKEKGRASGATAYLTKPFSPTKLLAFVRESLKKDA